MNDDDDRNVFQVPRGGVEVQWLDGDGMVNTQLVRSETWELPDGCTLITALEPVRRRRR